MRYIILAAGVGTRLHPLTMDIPKSLFKLDKDTSVLHRMISLIKEYDSLAEIIIITGFEYQKLQQELKDIHQVQYIYNPFFKVTNSIASLWFAKHLLDEEVVLINADVVLEERLVKEVLTTSIDRPMVFVDSSIRTDGDYNVQVQDDKVLVMSKQLVEYHGEYVGITKLDKQSTILLAQEVERMVCQGYYDQWYENALVQMIFNNSFKLYYKDVCEYEWCEVDSVDDLIKAKNIYSNDLRMYCTSSFSPDKLK